MIFVGTVLLLTSQLVLGNLHLNKIHGDTVWDTKSVVDEATRRNIFQERHGEWPDPKWIEREHPGYSKRMAERTATVMTHIDSQTRWDEWMFLAQARLMPTFTENQYDVVKAPPAVHAKLLSRFYDMLPSAEVERLGPELSGVDGGNRALFFPQEELNYEVLHELLPVFEEWAGVPLEPTSVYGVRVYRNGSTLRDHLDVLETHVISGILHVASELDAPYPIQIEDGKGRLASANLQPGDLMFYESAKCFHQRKEPMRGAYYASIFLHYRPKGWAMTRDDPRFAIPPYWSDGVDPNAKPVPGTRASATPEPPGGAEPSPARVIRFHNPPGAAPVTVAWISPSLPEAGGAAAANEVVVQVISELGGGGTAALHSFVGHTFVATTSALGPRDAAAERVEAAIAGESNGTRREVGRWAIGALGVVTVGDGPWELECRLDDSGDDSDEDKGQASYGGEL